MEPKRCVLDIETEGLEPWKDRLICIGCRAVDGKKTFVFFEDDEKTTLEQFLAWFNRNGFNEVIGYNLSFDMRFLLAKCLKYEIPAPELFNALFTDVMDNVRAVRKMYSYNKPGKLDDWLQYIFGIGKLEKTGSIKNLYGRHEFTRIINYNKQDVEMTLALWQRIRIVLCRN